VRRLYLFWTHKPTVYVDVSTTIDRKVDALRCHASQLPDFERIEGRVLEWSAIGGKEIGAAAADAFHLVVIDADDESAQEPSNEPEAAESGSAA